MSKTRQLLALALASLLADSPQAASICSVSVPNISFGSYDTINAMSAVGSVTVTCSSPGADKGVISYSIGSGTFASRTLSSGTTADTLQYNLYNDSAHTQVLGDGSAGTVLQQFRILGNAVSASLPVFAYLPGGQNVAPGIYTSAPITVTVTY